MAYTYTLRSVMPATPQQVYAAWLDSLAHTDMTGGEASMSDEVGAAVSAWDGYISGRNLELIPGKRIVQSWRTSRFTEAHSDSIVTITLKAAAGGTLLTLVHGNVPDEQRNYEDGGWEANYFAPMKAYFAELAHDLGEDRPQAKSTHARTPKRARKAAPPKKQKRAKPKTKRAARPKAKRKTAARPVKKRKSTKSGASRTARKMARRQRAHR